MTREPIYSALFALLAGISAVRFSSRRLQAFTTVSAADQPALFMEQKSEQCVTHTNMPSLWSLHVDILVYVNTGGNDPAVTPSMLLNPVLDAVMNALMPPIAIGEQTLGGLVSRCRLDGNVEIVEGVQGDQALAIVPVVVFTPD